MHTNGLNIAISGAGVAGPALAHWLLRGGHRPTLIERAPAFRTGGYVIDFWGVGYRIAQRMGIEDAVLEAGYAVNELQAVDRDGRVRACLRTDVLREAMQGGFTSLPRGDLAQTVFETVRDRAEVLFDESIDAVAQDDDGVTVDLRRTGRRRFDLLVGADGLHSNVRRQVFGADARCEHFLGCRVAACVVEGYRPQEPLTYVTYNVPGRQAARFTLRDDRTLFLFVFRSEDASVPTDDATRRAQLRAQFADAGWECARMLEAVDDADELYFDVVSQVRIPRWSRGRVALIGDAAACISLLGGEGTGLAMTEAYALAGELQRAGGDHRRAFDAYEARLRAFIEGKQASAQGFVSFFAARTRLGIWLRNLGLRAMNRRWIARRFAGRSVRDDLELPDYDW